MPYCPRCGAEVDERMAFCPKCGAPLRVEESLTEARPLAYKHEKAEKTEKQEKEEKSETAEKHEKREFGVVGPLIGGLFLIFLGLMFYLQIMGHRVWDFAWAFFLILVGSLIIIGVIYGMRRYPRP